MINCRDPHGTGRWRSCIPEIKTAPWRRIWRIWIPQAELSHGVGVGYSEHSLGHAAYQEWGWKPGSGDGVVSRIEWSNIKRPRNHREWVQLRTSPVVSLWRVSHQAAIPRGMMGPFQLRPAGYLMLHIVPCTCCPGFGSGWEMIFIDFPTRELLRKLVVSMSWISGLVSLWLQCILYTYVISWHFISPFCGSHLEGFDAMSSFPKTIWMVISSNFRRNKTAG